MKKIKFLVLFIFFVTKSISQTIITYNHGGLSTDNIQNAINSASDGDTLFIPYKGANNPWRVSKIEIQRQFASGITIEIDKRVTILAEDDITFTTSGVSRTSGLFQINDSDNITIDGNGAVIKRPKSNFTGGEWANTFNIISSDNVTIKNLIIEESGGDGIYIGNELGSPIESSRKDTNKNILIDNVIINNVARNAISVVDVDGLVVKNCTLKNTGNNNNENLAKQGPWAGVDFEPNTPWHQLKRITFKNNKFLNNKNSGISFGLKNLKKQYKASDSLTYEFEQELSINIENNYIKGNESGSREGVLLGGINNSDFKGYIKFNNNTIYNTRMGLHILNVDSKKDMVLEFKNTLFENAALNYNDKWATIFFKFRERKQVKIDTIVHHLYNNCGGINFYNTHVKNNVSNIIVSFDVIRDQDSTTTNLEYENINFNDFYLDDNYIVNPRDSCAIQNINYSITQKTLNTNKNPIIAFGDFNNDSLTDYFVKNNDFFKGLYLSKNDNKGKNFKDVFSGEEDGLGGINNNIYFSDEAQIFTGDFNADGKTDLFVNGYNYKKALYIANDSGNGFDLGYSSDIRDTDILNYGNPQVFTGNFYNNESVSNNYPLDEILIINPTHDTIKSALFIPIIDNGVITFSIKENVINDASFINNVSANTQFYIGDFDRDEILDLFVKDYTDAKYWVRYRGLFTNFNGQQFEKNFDAYGYGSDQVKGTDYELSFMSSDAKIYPGDYNGDGITDLFVKGYNRFKGLYISEINSDGKFKRFVRKFMNEDDGSYGVDNENYFTNYDAKIYTGDFDGNGTTDLFVNGYQNNRQLYLSEVYEGTTSFLRFKRMFSENSEKQGFEGLDNDFLFSTQHTKIFTGHFNNDSRTDLLVKGNNNYLGVYLANEDGSGFDSFISGENDETIKSIHYDWCFDNSSSNFNLNSESFKSIEDAEKEDLVSIFPNPASESIFVKSTFVVENISIYDVKGVLINESKIEKPEFRVDLKNLRTGIYLLELSNKERTITKKVVKE